jgi:transcriptional regulator with XRE-family HTH domain
MLTSMSPAVLVREARRKAKLTQAQLAERAGTTQPIVARLERGGGNPTIATLERALHASGYRLELRAVPTGTANVDEDLIRRQLALSPADRIRALDEQAATVNMLVAAGRRSRARRT